MTPAYRYAATVIRIVDGDTCYLNVDCGFRIFGAMEFRLYGINAPEVVGASKAAGLAAKAYLETLVPAGAAITVETFKDPEKYGRWLGILHTDGETASVNDRMVSSGNAVPYFPK